MGKQEPLKQMTLLTVDNIVVNGDGTPILKNISFSQRVFEKIAIAGETGSGKSTLLKVIAGLHPLDAGAVVFNDEVVKGPHEKLVPGHSGIAYLSQHFDLPHSLRVEQVLEYANQLSTETATTVYDICRISHLLKRRTDELSGGERQRIAIARIVTGWPKLILLDEPFSNLDMVHKNVLKTVIEELGEILKITCVLVSHDPLDTLSWADRIFVLKDGEVVQHGRPQELYSSPASEYVAGLFGPYNIFTPSVTTELCELFNISAKGKVIFARPEHIRLATASSKHFLVNVKAIRYFGSYNLIIFNFRKRLFSFKCEKKNVCIGDKLPLKFDTREIRFL